MRAIRAGLGGTADLVDRTPFRGARYHERGWKSLCTLVNILIRHSAGALTVQCLDEAEEVSLEAVRVCLFHSLTTFLHPIGLQFVLLLDDDRVRSLHFRVNLS